MVVNGPARRRLRAGRSSMLDNRRVRFRPGELGSEGRRRRCDPGEHSTRAAPLAAQTPPPQRPCRPAERDLTARGERALAARGERALAARGERDLTAREDCAGEIATSPRWDAGEKSATSMRGNATARGRRGESAGRARGAGTARAHLLPGLRAPGPPALFSHPGPGPLVTHPCANYGALPPAAPQLANSCQAHRRLASCCPAPRLLAALLPPPPGGQAFPPPPRLRRLTSH